MKQKTFGYFSTDVILMAKSILFHFLSHYLRIKFHKFSQNTSLASGHTATRRDLPVTVPDALSLQGTD